MKNNVKTISILIGNSDDKLSQKQWAEFVDNVEFWIKKFCSSIHFSGGSANNLPWQNYCFVFEVEADKEIWIKANLAEIKIKYNQDSIAWIDGQTIFL